MPKNTLIFEAPKSLFEQRMQNQANQLRRVGQQQQQSNNPNKPSSFPVYDNDELLSGVPPDPKPLENAMGRRKSSIDSGCF